MLSSVAVNAEPNVDEDEAPPQMVVLMWPVVLVNNAAAADDDGLETVDTMADEGTEKG